MIRHTPFTLSLSAETCAAPLDHHDVVAEPMGLDTSHPESDIFLGGLTERPAAHTVVGTTGYSAWHTPWRA